MLSVGSGGVIGRCDNETGEWVTDTGNIKISPDSGFSIAYRCLDTQTRLAGAGPCLANQSVFDAAAPGATLSELREVTIRLAAQSAADANIRMQLEQRVQVRNHRVTVAP